MSKPLPHAENVEAILTLCGDKPSTASMRTGIAEDRLAAHFITGDLLTTGEVQTVRRAYGRLGLASVSLPGFNAVLQFTFVMELQACLHRHERWPEPWPDDTCCDRIIGRVWRWWLRRRGLGHRIGRADPATVAAYAALGVGTDGERLGMKGDDD